MSLFPFGEVPVLGDRQLAVLASEPDHLSRWNHGVRHAIPQGLGVKSDEKGRESPVSSTRRQVIFRHHSPDRVSADLDGSSSCGAGSRTPQPRPVPRRFRLRPHRSVKTTLGVVSHSGPPPMHTCRPAYRAVRQRLAARPPGCPWHTSGWGRGGSDPPRQGLGTGSGRGGDSHPAPALLGSLPHQRSLAGRPSEHHLGTRRIKPILLRLPPLPKQTARAALLPATARAVPASGHPQRPGPRHRAPRLPLRNHLRRGFTSPLVHGDRRFEAAIRLAENRDAPDVRALWPSCKGLLVQPQSAQRLA